MAGYSGTPLAKKLGIQREYRVTLVGMPAAVERELQDALRSCTASTGAPLDYVHLFVTRSAALEKALSRFPTLLAPAGMVWISWPKRASGVATDLSENDVRQAGLAAGLVDIKVCAIDEVWSGLKFVFRLKDRPAKAGAKARPAGGLRSASPR